MPIAAPVGAAIVGGIAAAGGAAISSSAAGHAAALQASTADKQLAYEQQQAQVDQQNFESTQNANYGQYKARQSYLSNLGQMAGLPARTVAPPPAYTSVSGTLGSSAGAPTPAAAEQTVLMRAPNGQTKQVPASQVQHYMSLKAVPVMPNTPMALGT